MDGATLIFEVTGQPWSRQRSGAVNLVKRKDNDDVLPHVRKGEPAAAMVVSYPDGRFNWAITEPVEHDSTTRRGDNTRNERDTQLAKLCDWPRLKAGEWLRVAETAEFLDVSKNTARSYLRELSESNDVEAERHGQAVRYRASTSTAQVVSLL